MKKLYARVKEAFGEKCALCGLQRSQHGSLQLIVHHIDRCPENQKKENLIVFCKRCQSKVDKEARFFFLCRERQLELFSEENTYLEAMRDLWLSGLQRDFFESTPPLPVPAHPIKSVDQPSTPMNCTQLRLPTL